MKGRLPTSLEWSSGKAEPILLVPMSSQELFCSAVATPAPDFFFFFLGLAPRRFFPGLGLEPVFSFT